MTAQRRGWIAVGAVLTLAVGGLTPVAAADQSGAGVERVQPVGSFRMASRDEDGESGRRGYSTRPSISDDGRYVAFGSNAANLDPTGLCPRDHGCVYLYDRKTNELEVISRSLDGETLDPWAGGAQISGDGRFIAYVSPSKQLVPDDPSVYEDVFLYDRVTQSTTLITRNPDGIPAHGNSYFSDISADGRFVVYCSEATDLVPGDTNGTEHDVFRYDRVTGSTELVSVRLGGGRPASGSHSPTVDATGRLVGFDSDSGDHVSDDLNTLDDVFIRDMDAGVTTLISRMPDGQPAGASWIAEMSADGSAMVYDSRAHLRPADQNASWDVYRYDVAAGTNMLVSRTPDGTAGDYGGRHADITADGGQVVFQSGSFDLIDEPVVAQHAYVFDVRSRTVSLLSQTVDSVHGNDDSSEVVVSADGSYVAFQSKATNLARGDDHPRSQDDVFVLRRW